MACERIYSVKRGDTARRFEDHLSVDGESVDLTDAAVTFVMRTKSGTVLVSGNASVLQEGTDQDRTEPNVGYIPVTGDLETLGTHDVEWQVVLPSSKRLTFPQDGYHQVRVWDILTDESSSS